MLVTGTYHHGVIELPEEYKTLSENTKVRVEIPDQLLLDKAVDPKIEAVMQKVRAILGENCIGKEEMESDTALFIQGLEMAGKYGI